jgi:prevent-host-death family protein
MKTINIYDAKTNLSKLLERVQNGETITIAKAGKPIADLVAYKKPEDTIKFGSAVGKIQCDLSDFDGIDSEIQELFYGRDWDK